MFKPVAQSHSLPTPRAELAFTDCQRAHRRGDGSPTWFPADRLTCPPATAHIAPAVVIPADITKRPLSTLFGVNWIQCPVYSSLPKIHKSAEPLQVRRFGVGDESTGFLSEKEQRKISNWRGDEQALVD